MNNGFNNRDGETIEINLFDIVEFADLILAGILLVKLIFKV